MHCNANSVSSCIGDNKLKDKCWMNPHVVFVYFVDFKGSLCFRKAGNTLTFQGPVLQKQLLCRALPSWYPSMGSRVPGPCARAVC